VADRSSIIFVHGLGGHPQYTWEGNRDRADEYKSKLSSLASISTMDTITVTLSSEEHTEKLFWPNEYLTQDVPEARIWTYGYNADVVGVLFKANNKNSIWDHGRDFAVCFEREIQNEVGFSSATRLGEAQTDDDNRTQ